MDTLVNHGGIVGLMQDIAMIGAGVGVVVAALVKVYRMARNVEKIFEYTVESRTSNEKVAKDLLDHITAQQVQDHQRDTILHDMQSNIQEITREIRPNGGSSIKDTVTRIGLNVDNHTHRLDALETKVWSR